MENKDLLQLTRGPKRGKERKRKVFKRVSLGVVVLSAVGLGAIQTGAHSYLTGYGSLRNMFSEGKVTINLTEPKWTNDPKDPGNKEKVVPGDVFDKDPTVTAESNCVTPSFVYLQIRIPYAKVTKVNDDSTLYDKDANGAPLKKNHMLLTFGEGELMKTASDSFLVGDAASIRYDSASEILDSAAPPNGHNVTNNINNSKDGWTLLRVEDISVNAITDASYKNGVEGYLVFTYAYNSMIANTDVINDKYASLVNQVIVKKTTPLFNKVRTINCLEGQLDGIEYKTPIKAFAIQATHTGTGTDEDANKTSDGNGNGVPATTAKVIEQARKAFETYTNQNKDNGNAATTVSSFSS